jgi:hypothetical protein
MGDRALAIGPKLTRPSSTLPSGGSDQACPWLWTSLRAGTKVLIVVDGDNDTARTAEMLEKGLEFGGWVSAIPNPSIEAWLDVEASVLRRRPVKSRIEQVRQAAKKLDISALRAQDEQFVRFYDAILGV